MNKIAMPIGGIRNWRNLNEIQRRFFFRRTEFEKLHEEKRIEYRDEWRTLSFQKRWKYLKYFLRVKYEIFQKNFKKFNQMTKFISFHGAYQYLYEFKDMSTECQKYLRMTNEEIDQIPKLALMFRNKDCQMDLQRNLYFPYFTISTDKDEGVGQSDAYLTSTADNNLKFYGELNTIPVSDGKTKYSGFASFSSLPTFNFFGKEEPMNWQHFNCLVIRCRGDGRTYMMNLFTRGVINCDQAQFDLHSFPLYTRGGPYWQTAKIPFNRFFFQAAGRIQDRQSRLLSEKVYGLGILLGDTYDGKFNLEIDYIALLKDDSINEYMPYESYRIPRFTI
ncbi:hypothetical protein SNEBB_000688 [Seison nebaliae]|nr:hypothetical protein SNEBB_000688 [Seison nebaliae]